MIRFVPDDILSTMPLPFFATCKRYRAILRQRGVLVKSVSCSVAVLAQKAALDDKVWVLKTLRGEGRVLDIHVAICAAAQGHMDMLRWMTDNPAGFGFRHAMMAACFTSKTEVVRLLYARGGVWPEDASRVITRQRNMDLLEFMKEQGIPFGGTEQRDLWHSYYRLQEEATMLFGDDKAAKNILPGVYRVSDWLREHAGLPCPPQANRRRPPPVGWWSVGCDWKTLGHVPVEEKTNRMAVVWRCMIDAPGMSAKHWKSQMHRMREQADMRSALKKV